ncbi:GNAT family N-acetyltransferase [Trichlorobacter lovleyi]|uniref:GNAT family N-acetyltransferase n=1 Tax=Trichlorobacter lovleyi TaxID=313985 RepID=UPI00247FF357|nr:GNAT family protein [Trichlorobacter lovleyi]
MARDIPLIPGENIFLRGIDEKDLNNVMEWRNRPKIKKCFFNRNKLTVEGQQIWYENYLADAADHMFMIVTNNNVPIGTMALSHIDLTSSKAEYGRALIAVDGYQGKGYAKEALLLILQYAFNTLQLNRVFLEVFSDNLPAIKLYKKSGFITEGLLRDHYNDGSQFRDVMVMGILKTDFAF